MGVEDSLYNGGGGRNTGRIATKYSEALLFDNTVMAEYSEALLQIAVQESEIII